MRIQRFGIVLVCSIIIIFAFCITEDNAGVVLRNFKSRRMIMEELEQEEKALRARLSLNLTNSTDASKATIETASLLDQRNFHNSSDKTANIDDFAIGLKNISNSQIKNSNKNITTFKSQKSVVITNKTSSGKPNILTNSFVEYLENRSGRMEDRILASENDNTNKTSSRKPNILTKSVVEYLENRGGRMEDTILSSENDNIHNTSSRKPNTLTKSVVVYLEKRGKRMEDTISASENNKDLTPIWNSRNKNNESAPFRLISHFNESEGLNNEISENSSLEKIEDLDENKEISEAEQEEIFTALRDLGNLTLKSSGLDGNPNTEDDVNTEQQLNRNTTDIDNLNTNISDIPENNFSEMSPKLLEKENNDGKITTESESTDLKNLVSADHVKNSELNIPLNDSISSFQIEEHSKNVTNLTTEDTKKSLDDGGIANQVNKKESKGNESSIEKTVIETEEEPFELQESSDIIKETAKEIAEILPESNETIAVENIEEFVVNLTDAVQSISDEEIISLELEDKKISQLMQNEDTVGKDNVSVMISNDTLNEFELSLESVVSSGLDFIVNSEVAKNAAMAMEVFNLSDSSLTDHVIEDSDMHSFIDIVMPSVSLNEIESITEDRESIASNETIISNSSLKDSGAKQKNSTLDANSKFNTSLVKDDIAILENALDSNAKQNATSVATERKCPAPGICVFWFMARDACSDHSQCLGEQMCCRIRCSKSCIDI